MRDRLVGLDRAQDGARLSLAVGEERLFGLEHAFRQRHGREGGETDVVEVQLLPVFQFLGGDIDLDRVDAGVTVRPLVGQLGLVPLDVALGHVDGKAGKAEAEY